MWLCHMPHKLHSIMNLSNSDLNLIEDCLLNYQWEWEGNKLKKKNNIKQMNYV